MTLDEMIDAAKAAQRLPSDNALNYLLGFKGTALSAWRGKKAIPTPEHVVKLAQLADIDPEQALLERSIWVAESKQYFDLIPIYSRMKDKLKAAAAILVLFAVLLPAPSAHAENITRSMTNDIEHSIHYATLLFRLCDRLTRIIQHLRRRLSIASCVGCLHA